jgi:hypothetical protein
MGWVGFVNYFNVNSSQALGLLRRKVMTAKPVLGEYLSDLSGLCARESIFNHEIRLDNIKCLCGHGLLPVSG